MPSLQEQLKNNNYKMATSPVAVSQPTGQSFSTQPEQKKNWLGKLSDFFLGSTKELSKDVTTGYTDLASKGIVGKAAVALGGLTALPTAPQALQALTGVYGKDNKTPDFLQTQKEPLTAKKVAGDVAGTVGEIGSILLPELKLTQGLGVAAKLGKAAPVVNTALTSGLFSGSISAGRALTSGKDFKQTLQEAGKGAIVGTVLGTASKLAEPLVKIGLSRTATYLEEKGVFKALDTVGKQFTRSGVRAQNVLNELGIDFDLGTNLNLRDAKLNGAMAAIKQGYSETFNSLKSNFDDVAKNGIDLGGKKYFGQEAKEVLMYKLHNGTSGLTDDINLPAKFLNKVKEDIAESASKSGIQFNKIDDYKTHAVLFGDELKQYLKPGLKQEVLIDSMLQDGRAARRDEAIGMIQGWHDLTEGVKGAVNPNNKFIQYIAKREGLSYEGAVELLSKDVQGVKNIATRMKSAFLEKRRTLNVPIYDPFDSSATFKYIKNSLQTIENDKIFGVVKESPDGFFSRIQKDFRTVAKDEWQNYYKPRYEKRLKELNDIKKNFYDKTSPEYERIVGELQQNVDEIKDQFINKFPQAQNRQYEIEQKVYDKIDELVSKGNISSEEAQRLGTEWENMFNVSLKRVNNNPDIDFLSRSIRNMGALKLTFSQVQNLGQGITNTALITDLGSTFKGVLQSFTKEGWKKAIKSGAIDDDIIDAALNPGMTGGDSLASKWLNITQFTRAEKWNRVVTSNAVENFTNKVSKAMLSAEKKGNKQLSSYLKQVISDFGIDGNAVTKTGKISSQEMKRAMFIGTGNAQFLSRPSDLPAFASTPIGKLFFQFKSFGYQQTTFMKDMFVREWNRGPEGKKKVVYMIGTLAALFPATAEVTQDLRSLLTQKQRPTKKLDRYLDNINQSGAMGMFGSVIDAIKYDDLEGLAVPPTVGSMLDTAKGVYGLVTAKDQDDLNNSIDKILSMFGVPSSLTRTIRGATGISKKTKKKKGTESILQTITGKRLEDLVKK